MFLIPFVGSGWKGRVGWVLPQLLQGQGNFVPQFLWKLGKHKEWLCSQGKGFVGEAGENTE